MRVRFTVMPSGHGNIRSANQGRWPGKSGERPARTRHCDRGSPSRAPARRRSHWDRRAAREGARGGPGSQETFLRPTSRNALVEGVAHHMTKSFKAGATGLLLTLALAAPAAAATPTVSVRVEGQNGTLLPRTVVTPPDRPEPDTGCAADTAANALDAAVNNDWDNQQFTTTILGETHAYPNPDYWGFWAFRGGRYVATTGICDEHLQPGDELLAAYNVFDGAPTIFPLWITGVPARTAPGAPFTVTVYQAACSTQYCDPGDGHPV